MSGLPAGVDRVAWDDFLATRFAWHQGEHVALIGPTGQGKTTLANAILPLRNYVIAFGTKPARDSTLRAMARNPAWKVIKSVDDGLPRILGRTAMRLLLWVKFDPRDPKSEARQAYQIARASMDAFGDGGWCLYFDEVWYAEDVLNLKRLLRMLLTQGRSEGISVVGASQRPAFIQLLWYDQPTHLFFWADNDEANLKRLSGMNGINGRVVREIVSGLGAYEVLYVRTRHPRFMAVTKAPAT